MSSELWRANGQGDQQTPEQAANATYHVESSPAPEHQATGEDVIHWQSRSRFLKVSSNPTVTLQLQLPRLVRVLCRNGGSSRLALRSVQQHCFVAQPHCPSEAASLPGCLGPRQAAELFRSLAPSLTSRYQAASPFIKGPPRTCCTDEKSQKWARHTSIIQSKNCQGSLYLPSSPRCNNRCLIKRVPA